MRIVNRKSPIWLVAVIWAIWLLQPPIAGASQNPPCLNKLSSKDALLVADYDGQIIFKKNEAKKCIPASTLKLLTALAAIHHLGLSYRFKTEFYIDPKQNLKVKGYGDPLLISEALKEIADFLSKKIPSFNNLILDDTYFSEDIRIPGRECSTNPYDAPVGALCANFNTVFFNRDQRGRIVSAESCTPLIPYAQKKIKSLGLKKGRYTFTHDQKETAQYAGELLLHFLKEKGMKSGGEIRFGAVRHEERLVYTYRSRFMLEEVLKKMMKFSNNFIANQIFISMGAKVYGPPGTLAKGARAVSGFAEKELQLKDVEIVEGSGISRKNRISALDMLAILKKFEPYRHLLKKKGNMLYKTGGLRGIKTRAGYIEQNPKRLQYFVIFLYRSNQNINTLMRCIN